MSRTLVIGDIHGCYDELMALLDRVELQPDDRVIAVGDLIAKGNKSQDVLDLFSGDRRFASVLGNNDRALLRYWRGETSCLKNSQAKAAEELESQAKRYCSYLETLPPMIDLGKHLVVHAGIRPGVPLNQQSIEDLTELRTLGADCTSRKGLPWYDVYDSDKLVLFGHWPTAQPVRQLTQSVWTRAASMATGCPVTSLRLAKFSVSLPCGPTTSPNISLLHLDRIQPDRRIKSVQLAVRLFSQKQVNFLAVK